MRKYQIKQALLDLIIHEKYVRSNHQQSELNLDELYNKLKSDSLSLNDKKLLINDFLAGYLEFDDIGEPIGDTLMIELMIDYLSPYSLQIKA